MDHAPPFAVSVDRSATRAPRPWLWAITITVAFSALMVVRIHWAYDTPMGRMLLNNDRTNQVLIMSTHRFLLALPILAHLMLAWRWRDARALNLALAVLGLITWHQVWYPAGMGVLAMANLIPEWREVIHNFVFERPIFTNPQGAS